MAIGREALAMARPHLMLMDEPSMGLAPVFVDQVFDIIKAISGQGTTILVVEQNAAVRAFDRRPRLRAAQRTHRRCRQRRRAAGRRCRAARLSGRGLRCSTSTSLMQILPQQLVFGITLGMIYGLIALGYTMVYGVLFMINFAHGDVFMIGAPTWSWAVLVALITNEQIVPLNPILRAAADNAAAGDGVRRCDRFRAGAVRVSAAVSAWRDTAGAADQCRRRFDLFAELGDAERRRADEGAGDLPGVSAHLAVRRVRREHFGSRR